VATEIDFAWTYVAGRRALVERLIADPRLEIMPAHPDDTNVDAPNAALDGH
jgi:hypothetical protein